MTRVTALLTLLVFLPQAAHAQTVSASAYAQTLAPPSVPTDPLPAEEEEAVEARITYAEAMAREGNWREAGRAMAQATRLHPDAPRVRLARLSIRHEAAPSAALRLSPRRQQALLAHDAAGSEFSTAGNVLGVIGAGAAVIGALIVIVYAGIVGASSATAGIWGGRTSLNVETVAPYVGVAGGLGIVCAFIGIGLHAAASGHESAIHLTVHPEVSAEGGGLTLSGNF